MKKLILTTILFTNSIFALGNYIDTEEYKQLKPFLKEEQQIIFNNLMKDLHFSIETLEGKLKLTQNEKEIIELKNKKEALIKEKNEIMEKLNMNILKYPERYTKAAMDLKENINKFINFYSEVK
ncbi:hypothetical protein [uncultured Fusobacterium sp.]|uniref:hypothetical protein n=1 Tax=uncultured Fusobacterium sp. TaxID=159267 RepID=UPI0025F6CB1C|nr:hypothetical protein [uncultured Fusobacterium sp.]